MIDKLKDKNRFIKFQSSQLLTKFNDEDKIIYYKINQYLTEYLKFYNIKLEEVLNIHNSFIQNYIDDCKNFKITKKYETARSKNFKFGRIDYDIILILSCLLLPHRFNIINEIVNFDYK